jgi:hypothetical protein
MPPADNRQQYICMAPSLNGVHFISHETTHQQQQQQEPRHVPMFASEDALPCSHQLSTTARPKFLLLAGCVTWTTA